MNRATDGVKSIRQRLLTFMLLPLTAVMLLGIFIDYRTGIIYARRNFDQRLTDALLTLASQIQVDQSGIHVRIPAASRQPIDIAGAVDYHYAVVGPGHELLAGERQLPEATGASNPAYADATLAGQAARVASYRLRTEAGVAVLTVAGHDDLNKSPLRIILGSTILISFIQLGITLLLVWLGVHYGVKPLSAARAQIESRTARDLQPLDLSSVPIEVRPLTEALNRLFEMMHRAARTQQEFVADTAHQLRTPIAGMLGHLELLMRNPAAAALREQLTAVHEGMRRLAHSANQLLVLASADPTANLAERFEPVELQELAKRVVELNIDRSAECRLDLGAEAGVARVIGNARLLEDMLWNLLDNALSYTPAGGNITVRSAHSERGPYLEVEDDGPGIPESERTRVRVRFYRIPGTEGRGCGLGLAIVEEIARLHSAALEIGAGAGGRGTRVRVQFQ
ncbi:MAG TPA: sensor histidine kinase N-terminal domain-containing protein [Steroidobacteraceae bacterium]|nr:sensor histidine kinase N-terminal domain-containing protein [Steroidobacteraceae bacterium]